MKPVKISGLWPTKAGTGWSGRCANTRILVLPVDKSRAKDPSKAPDYELLLSPIDESLPLTPLPMPEAEAARARGYARLATSTPSSYTAKGTYRPQTEPPPDWDEREPPF